jgi:hypothetical protein
MCCVRRGARSGSARSTERPARGTVQEVAIIASADGKTRTARHGHRAVAYANIVNSAKKVVYIQALMTSHCKSCKNRDYSRFLPGDGDVPNTPAQCVFPTGRPSQRIRTTARSARTVAGFARDMPRRTSLPSRKFALALLRRDETYPKRSLRSRRKTAERIPHYRASLLGFVQTS